MKISANSSFLLSPSWFGLLAGASAAVCACGQDCDPGFPSASGSSVYVSAACGSASGDGSKDKPYATLDQGSKKAKSGDTVVVGAGSYTAGTSLLGGISLIGAGSGKVTISPAAGATGLTITGGGSTTIRGVTVSGATGYGVSVQGVGLHLEDVSVQGTKALADGSGGHGVQAQAGSELVIERGNIQNNAGTGVLTVGVGTVSIVDPAFAPSVTVNGTTSIVDPAFSPQSIIANNNGGGVAIVDPAFSPGQNDAPKNPVQITATNIKGNKSFGLAVFGGGATITRSAIQGTTKLSTGDFADGVVLAASDKMKKGALVIDAGSAVVGNGRAGVLAAVPSSVAISAEISKNETGGVWVQGDGAVVQMDKSARLRRNGLLGAAATKGARLEITGSTIENTEARKFAEPAGGMPEDVGDGVGVFNGASLSCKQARFNGNARAHVLAHQPKQTGVLGVDLDISANEFTGGQFGIVLNKGLAGKIPQIADLKGDNKFTSVKTEADNAGNLLVRSSVCNDPKLDADACAPKQTAPSK